MTISLIAACDLNNAIGYQNRLLCHLSNDLRHFKEKTEGNIIVMGRKTHESIGKVLPNRFNIVLTRDIHFNKKLEPDFTVFHTIDSVLMASANENVFIIGGQELYEQFMPHSDYIYLTRINHTFPKADRFFPEVNLSEWEVIEKIDNPIDKNHPYEYAFITYKRERR